MRVQITAKPGYSNPARNMEFQCGDVVVVPDALAAKLLHHGIAVQAPEPVIEAAVRPAPENAAKHVAKPKARKSSRPAKEEAD